MLREAPPQPHPAGVALHRRAAKHPPKQSKGLRTQSGRPNPKRESPHSQAPLNPIKKIKVMLREAPPQPHPAGIALHRRAAKHPPKRSKGLRTQSVRPNPKRESCAIPPPNPIKKVGRKASDPVPTAVKRFIRSRLKNFPLHLLRTANPLRIRSRRQPCASSPSFSQPPL